MKNPLRAVGAILVVLLLCVAFVSHGDATRARWYEELKTGEVDAKADRYTVDFADFASDSESSDVNKPPLWNSPGFVLTNNSETLSRTMRITRAQLTSRYSYASVSRNPLLNMSVAYTLAPKGMTCESSQRDRTLWTVKGVNSSVPADGVFKPTNNVELTLAPNETRHVCVDAKWYSSTTTLTNRIDFLGAFAGDGIKAVTDVATANKLSTDGTESASIRSLYRVGLPQPVPSPGLMTGSTRGCAVGAQRILFGWMRVKWDWPNSNTTYTASSAIDHWEVWTRPSGGSWTRVTDTERLATSDSGGARHTDGIIPADKREVFIDRAIINVPKVGVPSHSDVIIVGVLANQQKTRFVATQGWDLSWDGVGISGKFLCNSNVDPTKNLTGFPNIPPKEW